MDSLESTIVKWLLSIVAGVWGLASAYFLWLKKEDKKKLDKHETDIKELQSTAVTEDKVRNIVTDTINKAVLPMCKDMAEIKELVRTNTETTKQVQLKMAEQEGYQKAVKELKSQHEKE